MILDKKFDGTLDQGNGCLIIFDDLQTDDLYKESMVTLDNMDTVVDRLFDKVKKMKRWFLCLWGSVCNINFKV